MKKFSKIIVLTLLVLMIAAPVVSASSTPYSTYTYSSLGFPLLSPDSYVPDKIIDSEYMGLEYAIDTPCDLEVDPDGNVYIADAGNARIVVLDKYYKFKFEIRNFTNSNGIPDKFNAPKGVFVNEKNIYVCDTDNNRIVMFDRDGNFVKIVPRPESTLFENDDIYKPVAVAVDSYGRLFVVSSTTYQGIIVMNDDGVFTGFIGAQKVTISAIELLWRKFKTEEQKAYEKDYVSTEFNNITIDSSNFIYVTISSIDEEDQQGAITSQDKSSTYAPVKKLNASGSDVMRRNGFYPPSGEVMVSTLPNAKISGASKIVDAAIGPEETWSIIDEKRSKVFTYDKDGNLLFIFGDKGTQIGNIDQVAGIVYHEDDLLLLDKQSNSFTVYRRTEYGDTLVTALEHENNRLYDLAVNDWYEILKRNNNYDKAYIGIGEALYRNGQYEESLEYYRSASDVEDYSDSFKEIRKQWANKWFWTIPIAVVVVCILLAKFFGYTQTVNRKASLKVGRKSVKEELLYAFHVIVHPFDGFWDLKHEKRGSVRSAFVIIVITVLAVFYQSASTGYIFSPENNYSSIIVSLLSVIVPFLLWVIANWCLTTLFEGEGNLKDIFVASSYALTPLPLLIIPEVLLSNVLLLSEQGILTFLTSLAFVWVGLLLFFGIMITHDYSLGKNILTTAGTIVGMAFIMFMGILFSTLVGKMVSFVTGIIEEISFRL